MKRLLIILGIVAALVGSSASIVLADNLVQLTTNPTGDGHPDWSPDGTKIAFESNRSGNDDIWIMNADGSAQTQLTTDAGKDKRPYFSPDGTKIVWHSESTGNHDVWVMNSDGTGKTQITTDAAADVRPTWSPDGTKIVFESYRTGNADIWIMNSDGSGLTQLTTDPSYDQHPFWSPDGTKISFESGRSGNSDIWVMNPDGSGQVQLTTDPAIETHPSWSPDSGRISFRSERTGNKEVWIMNADGSGQVQLTADLVDDWTPDWSPDGTKMAISSQPADNADIWVLTMSNYTPSGPGVSTVTVNPEPSIEVAFSDITISGDTTVSISSNPVSGPPSGFTFRGNEFDISTDASYTPPIIITVSYDENLVPGNEQNLKMFHWNGSNWEDVTVSVDTANNTITGQANSLSPFILGGPAPATGVNSAYLVALALAAMGLGGSMIWRRPWMDHGHRLQT